MEWIPIIAPIVLVVLGCLGVGCLVHMFDGLSRICECQDEMRERG
jgi:uncharacterized integral membrane protein